MALLCTMAEIDLVDETFITVPPSTIVPLLHDADLLNQWWPDLQLHVFMDRGEEGVRWSMTGSLVGSCEIWLEEIPEGTLVHHYLRGVPTNKHGNAQPLPDTPTGWRQADKLRRRRALAWKKSVWALKDQLEGERAAGHPPPENQ